jgi:hypothetical protein
MSRLPEAGQHYTRIGRTDLALNPTQLYYYFQLKQQANFRTKRVDLRRQRRYMKDQERGPIRSGRTLRRVLAQLQTRGLVARSGRRFVHMIPDRRQKEIRMDLLYLVRDTVDVRIARFFLVLAFWPKGRKLADLTVDRILAVTGGDRLVALALHKWLQTALPGLSRKALRRRVFYADRPAWWLYGPCRRPDAAHWLGWTADYQVSGAHAENVRYGVPAYGSGSPDAELSRSTGPPVRFAEASGAGPGRSEAQTPNGHIQNAPSPHSGTRPITHDRSQAVEALSRIVARVKPWLQPSRPGNRIGSVDDCSAAQRGKLPRFKHRRHIRPPPDGPPWHAPPWWNTSTMGPYPQSFPPVKKTPDREHE